MWYELLQQLRTEREHKKELLIFFKEIHSKGDLPFNTLVCSIKFKYAKHITMHVVKWKHFFNIHL